jgi:hypothetical protein
MNHQRLIGSDLSIATCPLTDSPWMGGAADMNPVKICIDPPRAHTTGRGNTLSNNAGQRSPASTTVRDLPEHDQGGRW